jgi:hypothetical protein
MRDRFKQQIPHPLKKRGFGMTRLGGWLGDWQELDGVLRPPGRVGTLA